MSMNSKEYLKSYGWEEGEALRQGGLKKPILVKHKNDKKGLGNAPGNDDSEAWWERMFDGQLKNLDVGSSSNDGITFKQKEVVVSAVSKQNSPLYRWFVRGAGLVGTINKAELEKEGYSVVAVDEAVAGKKKRKRSDKEFKQNDKSKVKRRKSSDKKSKRHESSSESKKSKSSDSKHKSSKHKSDHKKKDGKYEKKNKKSKKHKRDKKDKKHKKSKDSIEHPNS